MFDIHMANHATVHRHPPAGVGRLVFGGDALVRRLRAYRRLREVEVSEEGAVLPQHAEEGEGVGVEPGRGVAAVGRERGEDVAAVHAGKTAAEGSLLGRLATLHNHTRPHTLKTQNYASDCDDAN